MLENIKCFCFNSWATVGFALIPFVIAGLLYLAVLFILHRTLSSRSKKIVKKARAWLLLLFLELAAFISPLFLDLPSKIQLTVFRFLVVTVIFTVTMGLISAIRALYLVQKATLGKKIKEDISARSRLTQALILYRFAAVAMGMIAVGASLMVFPRIRSIGIGVLGSAGLLGIAVGNAAKPILFNMMVGIQIAMKKMVRIGDMIKIQGYVGVIENLDLGNVVLKTWDNRRVLIPIYQLVEKEFESYDLKDRSFVGTVFMYCDYSVDMTAIRREFEELLKDHPLYDGHVGNAVVTDLTKETLEVRFAMSSPTFIDSFHLCAFVRERMIYFLQKEFPSALPSQRYKNFATPAEHL